MGRFHHRSPGTGRDMAGRVYATHKVMSLTMHVSEDCIAGVNWNWSGMW